MKNNCPKKKDDKTSYRRNLRRKTKHKTSKDTNKIRDMRDKLLNMFDMFFENDLHVLSLLIQVFVQMS